MKEKIETDTKLFRGGRSVTLSLPPDADFETRRSLQRIAEALKMSNGCCKTEIIKENGQEFEVLLIFGKDPLLNRIEKVTDLTTEDVS